MGTVTVYLMRKFLKNTVKSSDVKIIEEKKTASMQP